MLSYHFKVTIALFRWINVIQESIDDLTFDHYYCNANKWIVKTTMLSTKQSLSEHDVCTNWNADNLYALKQDKYYSVMAIELLTQWAKRYKPTR